MYDADNNGFVSQADFTNLADHMANNLGIAGTPRHDALRAWNRRRCFCSKSRVVVIVVAPPSS